MKNIVAAFIMFAMSAMAYAVPGCDMKRTAEERASCSNLALSGGIVRMKKNYEKIFASSNIPQNEKDYIGPNHETWAKEVEGNCNNNVDCTYDAVSSRNREIEKYMRGKGLQPI